MKIVVLCGGVSPEREVSLNSGAAVADALSRCGYDTLLYDIKSIREFTREWDGLGAEGVFIALHGGWGENGRIQAVLESLEIPYTGSGPEASMISMDKNAAKIFFAGAGVKVPDGFLAVPGNIGESLAAEYLKRRGKLTVKPNCGGSTVGLTFLTEIGDYRKALETVWRMNDKALVEEYIPGEEATVAVWEREEGAAEALPPVHIKPKSGFYDYRNKYTHGCTEYVCPADFSGEINSHISAAAVAAHNAIGCRGYSRVDFRITPEGEAYALEANTAPGMTTTSLVPKAARARGIEFGDFLSSVIKRSFAIKR